MEHLLSERIKSTPPSFIRSILKTAADPQIISFAGGLPNPVSFPQEELLVSMERIVRDYGSSQMCIRDSAYTESRYRFIDQDSPVTLWNL